MRRIADAPLQALNTFSVEAHATELITLESSEDVEATAAEAPLDAGHDVVLGGGSNVLLVDNIPGRVLLNRIHGRQVLDDDGDFVQVELAAGENWHDCVLWSLEQGLCGLENLSLIPGCVGAAPIQNIGAYGADLALVLESVRAWDWSEGLWVDLDQEACRFEYRDSLFKSGAPDRYLIATIRLRLSREFHPHTHYPGVQEELDSMGVTAPTARDVSDAVIRIRRRKLPDPSELGNAGSFFKNPLVSMDQAEVLKIRHPDLPTFHAGGNDAKLSAAWMIEQCGWKGHREGDAGVSETHALVLVNHGRATGREIWDLAQSIDRSVAEVFGIQLQPEPRILGPF